MIPHSEKMKFRVSAVWSWQPALPGASLNHDNGVREADRQPHCSVPQFECLMSPWLDAGDMSSDTSFPHCEPPSDSVPLLTSFTLTSGFRLLFCEARCPLSSTPAMWILVPRCACNLFIYLYLKSQTISYFIQSVSNLLQSLFTLTLKLPSLANGIPFKLVLWSFRSPSFCEHFLFSRTKRRAGHLVHFLGQPWNQPFFEGVWLIWEEHSMCHVYRRSGLLTTAGAPRSSSDTQTGVLWGQWFQIGFLLHWPNVCEVTLALLLGWNILNCVPRKMSPTVKCHCILDWGKNH